MHAFEDLVPCPVVQVRVLAVPDEIYPGNQPKKSREIRKNGRKIAYIPGFIFITAPKRFGAFFSSFFSLPPKTDNWLKKRDGIA
jgi:hypothetical protein